MTTLTSVDAVGAAIRAAAAPCARTLVGIVGAPGAGKSTLAAAVVDRLEGTAALLPMDGFHLPQARLIELGRRDRMGAPDTFDLDGFLATLALLRASGADAAALCGNIGTIGGIGGADTMGDIGNSGEVVSAPGFDRTREEPVPGLISISPELPTVVVEGNYLLFDTGGWERVSPLLDLVFFVAVDRDIRLGRLIDRHVRFGKSPAAAEAWALGPDERNAVVIEATAARADHIVRL